MSYYRTNRILVACNYCYNVFKTFNDKDEGCSVCCRSIESKLKT